MHSNWLWTLPKIKKKNKKTQRVYEYILIFWWLINDASLVSYTVGHCKCNTRQITAMPTVCTVLSVLFSLKFQLKLLHNNNKSGEKCLSLLKEIQIKTKTKNNSQIMKLTWTFFFFGNWKLSQRIQKEKK